MEGILLQIRITDIIRCNNSCQLPVSSQFLLKLYGFFFREMNFFASMAVDDENFLAVHQ